MNTDQALQVCGCFALGLDVSWHSGTKYYSIRFDSENEECLMTIAEPVKGRASILHFEVMDVSVNDGCLVIDLTDFQMRIDLGDDAA